MKRLILFLIRRKLHISAYTPFIFDNQKSKRDFYYITHKGVKKYDGRLQAEINSNVSINWLLDKECKITKIDI